MVKDDSGAVVPYRRARGGTVGVVVKAGGQQDAAGKKNELFCLNTGMRCPRGACVNFTCLRPDLYETCPSRKS